MADSDLFAAAFAAVATVAASTIMWIRAELAKIEQKDAVKTVVAKLNQSNSQGDSLASVAKLIVSDVVTVAAKDPILSIYVDKLKAIHADAVKVWDDPDGSDAQMADLVKAANDVYGIIQNAMPKPAPAAAPAAAKQ